ALSQSEVDGGDGASRPVRLVQADPAVRPAVDPAVRPAVAGAQQRSSRGLDAEMHQEL
ncbi:unnamed protein product, partial [Symbiodinium necroappetens]